MFFKKKSKTATCPVKVLFEILDDNLRNGLCTDITFLADGQKHRFGAWGDQGETHRNVVYYLDQYECSSRDEWLANARVDGVLMQSYSGMVTVTECDGCYPDSTARLRPFLD